MKNATDFIKYALSHAKPESIPEGASLPMDPMDCGTEPWEYLYGTTGCVATEALLDERYRNYYKKRGWTRESFDIATENWALLKKHVTDCQGLLDSYLGADVTAHYCYMAWCTEKGLIEDIERPFTVGEAVFFKNTEGRFGHVGFVCGFLNGEPLVVEARGVRFGVMVTRLSERPWTHRGLVTGMLSYDDSWRDEPVVLSIRRPMIQGKNVLDLQKALNALGYYCGKPDGKCGRLTMSGVRAFARAHSE